MRCLLHLHSLQVRSLAYDLSIRLPVDAFKGTSHDAGQRLGGGYAGLCLGDPDIGELTISEMSPEDIRAELKRYEAYLYVLLSLFSIHFRFQTVYPIGDNEEQDSAAGQSAHQ